MTWERQYWDLIEQLYWTPDYLGLQGISQKHWLKNEGLICLPESLVNASGPLYTRYRRGSENLDWLRGKEEILNHVFNITFAIAPDAVLQRLFFSPLGISDSGPIASLGREIRQRYGWSKSENVTQPDGVFVSDSTAIGVELKLKTNSSPAQLAKYVSLLTWEELASGSRKNLGLLYILPDSSLASHWGLCGLSGPTVDQEFLDVIRAIDMPRKISELVRDRPDHVASVLARLKLGAVSWSWIRQEIESIVAELNPNAAGDQTIQRLLAGFQAQLNDHRDTGLPATQ